MLPISLPGIFATATYVFFMTWQELMFSLALINSQEMRTVPFGVLGYIGEHSTDWGLLMAASVLVCVPVFVFFLLVQRQFIAGLTAVEALKARFGRPRRTVGIVPAAGGPGGPSTR